MILKKKNPKQKREPWHVLLCVQNVFCAQNVVLCVQIVVVKYVKHVMVLCFQDVGAIDVVLSCVQSVMLSCVQHINIDCLMYGSVVWVKSFQPVRGDIDFSRCGCIVCLRCCGIVCSKCGNIVCSRCGGTFCSTCDGIVFKMWWYSTCYHIVNVCSSCGGIWLFVQHIMALCVQDGCI